MDFEFLPQQVIPSSTYNSHYNKHIYDSIFNVAKDNKLFNDNENNLVNYNISALNDLQNERSIFEKNFDCHPDYFDNN